MSEDCVFCQIVAGTLPSSVVHETAAALVLMDVDPVTPGHLLVIPKAHLPALADLSDTLACDLFSLARTMASALRQTSLRCEGVNLFYADGEAAFQEIFHAHLHVFPRFPGDGFVVNANWGSAPDRSELDALASQIRDAVT